MGIFNYELFYNGEIKLDPDTREKFTEELMKILHYGGMMRREKFKIGKNAITVLCLPKIGKNNIAMLDYNYFEDTSYGDVVFDSLACRLESGGVGEECTYRCILAAYALFELYGDDASCVIEDFMIANNVHLAIAWINHLLKKDYGLEHRFHLWDIIEKYCLKRIPSMQHDSGYQFIKNLLPSKYLEYAGGTDLTDLCAIKYGIDEQSVIPDTYPADLLECTKRIQRYLNQPIKGRSIEMKQMIRKEKIISLLRMDYSQREQVKEPLLKDVAQMTLILPARVIAYLTSNLMNESFWINWASIKWEGDVYHDEVMKKYVSEEIEAYRIQKRKEPIMPQGTTEYLKQVEQTKKLFLMFRNKQRYELTDDDRLLWWDGSDEVVISKDTQEWLATLAKRHGCLMQQECHVELLPLLKDINTTFFHVYPLKTMVEEFMRNSNDQRYKAAIKLLELLYEENKNDVVLPDSNSEIQSHVFLLMPERVRMKRYLSVMANKELRQKYFCF